MLQKIKTVLQHPYAAPLTEPFKQTWKLMKLPVMSILDNVQDAARRGRNTSFIAAAVDFDDITLLSVSMIGGAAGGMGLTLWGLLSGATFMAGSALATKIAAGAMLTAVAGTAGFVAGPFVIGAACAATCGTLGVLISPYHMFITGTEKIIKHAFRAPPVAPAPPPAVPVKQEPSTLDKIIRMSNEDRQQLLAQLKEKCAADFDAVAYPQGSSALPQDLVVKPSPFVKNKAD